MAVHVTYFVHGTTTDNERGLMTGQQDGELSARGLREAAELGAQVADQHFDAVFSSDLARAARSAELAFGKTHVIVLDERLRECNYGDRAGTLAANVIDTDYIREPFPNGESYHDVETRMKNFLAFLKESYDGNHVALMSHRFPQLALDVILKNKTWEQALAEDWRTVGVWQPGWEYELA
ncbi:MAG: histidine phosphatase family protein [Patescibacteria group bacterium]|nr:histidine phosphatase family protein [Patescibacteria group bacterium]